MLVYDATDRRASELAAALARKLPLGVPVVAAADADLPLLGLTPARLEGSFAWIGTDGVPREGNRALAAALRCIGGTALALVPLAMLPGGVRLAVARLRRQPEAEAGTTRSRTA